MRPVPAHVHREVLRRDSQGEPSWYVVWLGAPHAEGSVVLGRAERLRRGRWWRAYPVNGDFPEPVRVFGRVIDKLLESYEKEGGDHEGNSASAVDS